MSSPGFVDGQILTAAELNTAFGSVLNNTDVAAAMLVWFNSLPTTLPGTAGVLWNNNGTLAQS